MDEIKQQEVENHQKKYQTFLQSINCCPLCTSPLTLIHEVDEESSIIKETAHCDQCDVETRRKEHPIQ
ncbi:MAG: hypothetical protein KDD33_04810 [Bdellovibrionales bacterium]|nr:hypothetical protein [Bdellovibrionales bacterium]